MNRFILNKEGIEVARFQSVRLASEFVGCTYQHIYKQKDGVFKYKKVNYQLIDRLELLD
tara:strand:+ start:610 stop:786 length:177 start_codon:yes stop_codon:yes gene_type:complete